MKRESKLWIWTTMAVLAAGLLGCGGEESDTPVLYHPKNGEVIGHVVDGDYYFDDLVIPRGAIERITLRAGMTLAQPAPTALGDLLRGIQPGSVTGPAPRLAQEASGPRAPFQGVEPGSVKGPAPQAEQQRPPAPQAGSAPFEGVEAGQVKGPAAQPALQPPSPSPLSQPKVANGPCWMVKVGSLQCDGCCQSLRCIELCVMTANER
jgi:hypothetical protein